MLALQAGFLSYADGGRLSLHPYAKQLLRNSFEWPIWEVGVLPVRRDDGDSLPLMTRLRINEPNKPGCAGEDRDFGRGDQLW